MIADAYAVEFAEDTASVIWGECPIPGTQAYNSIKNSVTVWRFTFHNVPSLPEALVQGKERMYLKHFFDRLAQNPNAISAYDSDVYTNAFPMPGA